MISKIRILSFIIPICILLVISFCSFRDSFYYKLKYIDLKNVINPDSIKVENNKKIEVPEILGFYDTNFYRVRIHIMSFEKEKNVGYKYTLSCKIMNNGEVCTYNGYYLLIEAKLYDSSIFNFKQGYLVGKIYMKSETKNKRCCGEIEGNLETYIYIDSLNNINYDELLYFADGYYNNQFKGKIKFDREKKYKKFNWGHFRIPESKGLDTGSSEFIPDEKYLNNGWKEYYDCYVLEDTSACLIEKSRWWDEK